MNENLRLTILVFLTSIGVIGYISLLSGVRYLWEISIPLSIGSGLVWAFGLTYGIVKASGVSEVGCI